MKYLQTINGNHSFDFNGAIIVAWVVVGNEKLCVSLDNYKGQWLGICGNFKRINTPDNMLQYLIRNKSRLDKWLPVSMQYAETKRQEQEAKAQTEKMKVDARVKKDRALKIYRSITLQKGSHKISIVTQPYNVGIYIAISDSKLPSLIQTGANNHRGVNRLIDRIISTYKGYKVQGAKLTVSYPLN